MVATIFDPITLLLSFKIAFCFSRNNKINTNVYDARVCRILGRILSVIRNEDIDSLTPSYKPERVGLRHVDDTF